MPSRLLCIGDLNADITITPDAPIVNGSDTPGVVRLTGGGSAANVAVAAVTEAGGQVTVRFAGVVGDDLLGDVLVDELRRVGIDACVVRRPSTASRGVAAFVGLDGERSMVSDLDSATAMTVSDVDDAWFDGVDWLHLTGYSLFVPDGPALVAQLVGLASDRSIPWSFDPSSAEMYRSTVSDLIDFTNSVAIVFPNRDEAAAMTGLDDPIAAARALLDVAETAIVTCGADGAHLARRGRSAFHVAAASTDIVNTLGCGDAFAGGFVSARLRGESDEECARRAALAAARVASSATSR